VKHTLIVLAALGLFAATMFGFRVIPADASINPCTDGTTDLPQGTVTTEYTVQAPPADRSYNGYPTSGHTRTRMESNREGTNGSGPDHGIKLGGDTVPSRLCIGGPVIDGDYPYTLTWRQMHDSPPRGGYGLQMFSNDIEIKDLRVDNVEDGIKLQNCPEDDGTTDCNVQKPTGKANIDSYFATNIRDDMIDDDDCMPFSIDDSWLEGHTGISEQEESSSTGNCVSSGEDSTINVSDTAIRSMPTNAYDGGVEDDFAGGGKWLKWQGSTTHHTVVFTNTILAVDQIPRSGWSSLDMPGANGTPGDTQWVGTGNYILYLNMKGQAYGGPTPGTQGIPGPGAPNEVHFLSGGTARKFYWSHRNQWLSDHGLATRSGDGVCGTPTDCDLNTKDDPVGGFGTATANFGVGAGIQEP
jgi:hypothetical protein